MSKYVVVQWPESQYLFDKEGFEDNCYLIDDLEGQEKFGSSAYFVEESWLNSIKGLYNENN